MLKKRRDGLAFEPHFRLRVATITTPTLQFLLSDV
jgi:hypothetical protein